MQDYILRKKQIQMEKIQGEWIVKSHSEIENLEMLRQSLKDNIDLMGPQWNHHMLTFITRQSISRILYLDNLYRTMMVAPGAVLEFGVQWGGDSDTVNKFERSS